MQTYYTNQTFADAIVKTEKETVKVPSRSSIILQGTIKKVKFLLN
jgi:3-polyprenyl-4-hydroxybenzoate decarboxylase